MTIGYGGAFPLRPRWPAHGFGVPVSLEPKTGIKSLSTSNTVVDRALTEQADSIAGERSRIWLPCVCLAILILESRCGQGVRAYSGFPNGTPISIASQTTVNVPILWPRRFFTETPIYRDTTQDIFKRTGLGRVLSYGTIPSTNPGQRKNKPMFIGYARVSTSDQNLNLLKIS